MLLPALVSDQFPDLKSYTNEAELLEDMKKNPREFLRLFENVTEFDSWCEKHPVFIKGALNWFTEEFYHDRLSIEYGKRIGKIVQEHFSTLDKFLPRDLALVFQEREFEINSLMLGISSPVFRQRLIDEKRKKMKIEGVTIEEFLAIGEFIETGTTWKLWRKSQEALIKSLIEAEQWRMESLIQAIQEALARYVDSSNVVELLILSYQKHWLYLKQECMDCINREDLGIRLVDKGPDYLAIEFLDYRQKALDLFEDLRNYVTHIASTGVGLQAGEFREVLNKCPRLIGIDIAHSSSYSENLKYLPSNLQQLDVSKCGWLNAVYLKELITTCPRLNRLNVGSNSQLNYNAWSEIQRLKELTWLDISRSRHMNVDDFKIILKACRLVTYLNVEDCTNISEDTFFEIGRAVPYLEILDVSRTNISDSSLIEIATRCKALTQLTISRCLNLSDKGVVETAKEGTQLKVMNVEKLNLKRETLEEIRSLNPSLVLVYSS